MNATPERSRVLVVLAHPDDESLACGGTLARLADAGCHVRLVCATRGESGDRAGLPPDDTRPLAEARTFELQHACRALGVETLDLWDYPDGELSWTRIGALLDQLTDLMRAWDPDIVITFGRDGLYWHPDHIAIGERVRAALSRGVVVGRPAAYAVVMPPGAMTALAAQMTADDARVAPTFWGLSPAAFGHGALPATHVIDVTETLPRKVAAIRAHVSQLAPTNPLAALTVDRAQPLAVEHFHLLETSPGHRSFLDMLARRHAR